jgi:hypothetical protein
VETPIRTPDRKSLVLVYYDVQDRTAGRAADAEPPGSDRDRIRELLTSGDLGVTFKEDTESVYYAYMLATTNRIEHLATNCGA